MDLNLGSTRALIDECRRQGLLRNQCAYVLATAMWETAGLMKPVKETTSKKNPNPTDAQVKRILTRAWKAGKLPWVKKDYWSAGYFGRGFPQLTHLANYQKASDKLGVDFVAHPDLVMELKYAVLICVTGMKDGWFTGKKLSDFLTASKSDFFNARSIINADKNVKDKGAKETHGQLIAKMARDYDMDLQVTGYAQKKPASTKPAPLATITPIEAKPAPATALIPVKVPGLDKPMVKSSTMWAALSGVGITGIASAKDAIDSLTGLDWRVTMAIVGLGAAAAAYWIISERIKYRRAQRDMVAGVKAASAEQ